jgi:hypothetical protein
LNILITTNNTKASLALAYLLKDQKVVFGTDFKDFPKAESESLAHEVLAFCLDHQITSIYPVRPKEVEALLKASILFSEYDININFHHLAHQNNDDVATDFTEFSARALKLGYPNQKIAIGLENQTGKILVINDEVKDFNQLWSEIESISFIQVGKLFNSIFFQSLSLFKIEGDIRVNYLLVRDSQFLFHQHIEIIESIISKEIIETLKDGFYTIYSSGGNTIRISNF